LLSIKFLVLDPKNTDETLVIAYAAGPVSLDPFDMDVSSRNFTNQIFEPLVRLDKDMNLTSGLALSWGKIDDLTWEFKLRPDVKFHNGESFTSKSVISSFGTSSEYINSDIKGYLSSIEKIDEIDDLTIRITTKFPDPDLPRKLTVMNIYYLFPNSAPGLTNEYFGTGAYVFDSSTRGRNYFYNKFEDYWGEAHFPSLNIRVLDDGMTRIEQLKDSEIDILGSTPPTFIEDIDTTEFEIKRLNGLDTVMILFNSLEGDYSSRSLRQAVQLALDPSDIQDAVRGFGQITSQLVSSRVFGYNEEIELWKIDIDKAKDLKNEVESFYRIDSMIYMPQGAEGTFRYLEEELRSVEIVLAAEYLEPSEYDDRLSSGDFEMMLFTWRSEDGSTYQLFRDFINNASFYENIYIDEFITQLEDANEAEDEAKILKDMMVTAMYNVIAVPLFTTDIIITHPRDLNVPQRVDGYIYANQINL